MNWSWLSFVVGLLVGWLIEWLIDYFFWRRKHRAQQTEIEDLKQQLADAQAQRDEQETKAAECAQALDACRAELAECLEAAQAAAQAAAQEADTRAAAAVPLDLAAEEDADEKEGEVDTTAFSTEEADEAEIHAGALPPDELDAPPETDGAGPSDDEPEEAPTLDDEDEAAATRAVAAVIPLEGEDEPVQKPTAVEKQDLTKIEGIGPKTQGLLNEAGIIAYGQLADTSVERLQEILDAAGSRYRIIRPGTWPQQARLAAEEKWDELEVLQNNIVNGEIVQHD